MARPKRQAVCHTDRPNHAHGLCAPCSAKKSYSKNKHQVALRTKQGNAEWAVWLKMIKDKPCLDCGNSFPPECMDFDHIDPATKSFTVGQGVRRCKDVVLAEIAKCELVCANCHRIRTFRKKIPA